MSVTNESSVPVFDTRRYVHKLTREGGVGEKQAHAQVDALQEALQGVATKADIEILKAHMKALEAKMEALESKMEALESKTQTRFDAMERNAQWDRRFMATGFAVLALMMTMYNFF